TSFSRDWSSGVCSSDLMNFLLLLLEKRRESILEAVAGGFTALANEVRDVVGVEVRTARALSDEEREALSRRMSEYVGKKIRLIEIGRASSRGGGRGREV